jgi:putative tricarboxylic transport membrane protein
LIKKLNGDAWAGIIIFIFALIFLIESLKYPYDGDMGIGPGFGAMWLSVILLVFVVIYIFQSLKANKENQSKMPSGLALKNISYIVGSLILYVLLVSYLGFTLTSTIFLFLLLRGSYKWYVNLLISIGSSIMLCYLFYHLLRVALPVNGLGW